MVLTFSFAVIQMSYLNTFDISGKWMFASKYHVLITYISIWKILDVVMFAFNDFESMVAEVIIPSPPAPWHKFHAMILACNILKSIVCIEECKQVRVNTCQQKQLYICIEMI